MREKVILLVEDNPYDVALTQEAFKVNNYYHKIILAKDGKEALDILFANIPVANINALEHDLIILLDLKLPKINGIEVLKAIKTNKLTRLLPARIQA